jgi:hypothetical protein
MGLGPFFGDPGTVRACLNLPKERQAQPELVSNQAMTPVREDREQRSPTNARCSLPKADVCSSVLDHARILGAAVRSDGPHVDFCTSPAESKKVAAVGKCARN